MSSQHSAPENAAADFPAWSVWQRLLMGVGAAALLAAAFAMYIHPDFMVTMADQLWACF